MGLDAGLSKYYQAFQKGFTIKINETDYTNIEGGKGIFASLYSFSKTLDVDSTYIRSFGYHFNPK